ncbi:MAG: universal stress protein [Methylibium sp.]|nr:universal stress protein [Methylibium sp.]MBA3589973.1 universal stress protein [Methylibium sp.]MBA3624636.1 universal stress protein [Methylibium sp.]
MNTALIPIDGSSSSLRALAFALHALRGRPDAQIHVLNVQAPLLHPWPGKLVSPDMIDAELRSDGEKLLVQAEIMALAAGIGSVAHVSIGAAAQEITAYAAKHGCDVIVMGTRGMGAVANLVVGSVAQRVVHLATVPVTLVK